MQKEINGSSAWGVRQSEKNVPPKNGGKNNIKFYILAFLLSAVFGWLIEEFQGMLDYRSKDVFDWLADVAGSLSACTLIGLIRLAFR